MSGKKSRNKGYRGEHNLQKILNKKGIKAKRIPLSGADDYVKGDIDLIDLDIKAEVKLRKTINSIFYDVLEKNKVGFFKADRKPYFVVMDLDFFCELIKVKKNKTKGGKK